MAIQLFIGFTVEGTTDTRFLKQVIQSVFEETAFQCKTDVEIEDIRVVDVPKTNFVDTMCNAAKKATEEYGMSILCIHADSDAKTLEDVTAFKFEPLRLAMVDLDGREYCKNIVPVIPIQMTEAWMLADKELLKTKIDAAKKRDQDLGLHRAPESYSDPKQAIVNAIRIAQTGKTKRTRTDLTISDLYEELGQTIKLERLRTLPSFNVFEENVQKAFRLLGYIE